MNNSERLGLPYIAPQQAQKHVTHNEAIGLLDKLVHLAVEGTLQAPPDGAIDLDSLFLVGEDAIGVFAGNDNAIATYEGTQWSFFAPKEGWVAFDKTAKQFVSFLDGQWSPLRAAIKTTPHLGINATADDNNRLVARSASTLLTAEQDSHRLYVNKAATGDTASCVFQSAYEAHAEIGLTGDNALSFKVLDSTGTWQTSLRLDKTNGMVHFPAGSPSIAEPNILRNGDFTIWQRGLSHQLAFPSFSADGWRIGRRSGGPVHTTAMRHGSGLGAHVTLSALATNKRHLTVCQINTGVDIADIAAKGVATFAIDIEVSTKARDGIILLVVQTSKNEAARPWSAGVLDDGEVDRSHTQDFVIQPQASRYELTLSEIAPDTKLVLCSLIYIPPAVTDSQNDHIVLRRAKLEATPFATRFIPRAVSVELSECQRFFRRSFIPRETKELALEMRAEPIETFDGQYFYDSDI